MKTKLILGLAVTCLITGNMAFAQVLLVNRGLPTANLNNDAGLDRSNVAWAFAAYTSPDYYLVGDTFKNTSSQTWSINSIRLWTVGTTTTAMLWGGLSTETPGVVSGPVTYTGGITYQGSLGGPWPINQVDFAVNITLAAGQTYDFFLDGSGSADAGQDTSVPFVHASNMALSGSPQDGSDNLMLYAEVLGGSFVSGSVVTWSSSDPDGGWDKPSDVNVQVFGSVPEGGSTLVLMGFALAGLGTLRRRIRKN